MQKVAACQVGSTVTAALQLSVTSSICSWHQSIPLIVEEEVLPAARVDKVNLLAG